jgi:hypothetical protein
VPRGCVKGGVVLLWSCLWVFGTGKYLVPNGQNQMASFETKHKSPAVRNPSRSNPLFWCELSYSSACLRRSLLSVGLRENFLPSVNGIGMKL